jgi:thiamine biosynthesis lipoprotein
VSAAGVSGNAGDVQHVEHVMGMAVSFDLRNGPGRDGLDEAIGWLHHVDRTFSTYDEGSVISRIARGEMELRAATAEVRDILALCERLRLATGGAFDAFAVPAPNGTMLDPSGVVKGWSVEHAARILERRGHVDFTVNAGGDISVRGRPEPDRPWRVGIRHPDRADRLATVLELVGPVGVATSATYERGAHIVDPRTGQPVTELASVTIVGTDLTLADAYATAVFVMGLDGLDWIADQPDFEALIVTRDDRVLSTPGIDRWRPAGTRS